MTIEALRNFLGWCAVINYVILLVWFLIFRFAYEPLYSLQTRWFKVSQESFGNLNYAAMAAYKLTILFFNIVPYLVLRLCM